MNQIIITLSLLLLLVETGSYYITTPPTARLRNPTALLASPQPTTRRSLLRAGLVLPFLPQATLASTTTTCAPILSNPSISTLRKNGRQVTILGTAHVSDASAELSRDLVRSLQPDTVFIELDAKRVKGGKFGETDNASSTGSSTTTKKPSFVSNLKSKILGAHWLNFCPFRCSFLTHRVLTQER